MFTSAYSILCQVGANVTLHVVADGFEPSDETKRLAEEFENLKLYRNEKVLGPYLSVMRIFHNFKTDFFAIQDADDYSLPHRIWHAVTTLQRTGYDLFGATAQQNLAPSKNHTEWVLKRAYRDSYHRSGVVWDSAPLGMCVHPVSVFRKSSFESINGYADFVSGADCEINTRGRVAGWECFITPAIHGVRTLRSESLSNGLEFGDDTTYRKWLVGELERRYSIYASGNVDPKEYGALERTQNETHKTKRIV